MNGLTGQAFTVLPKDAQPSSTRHADTLVQAATVVAPARIDPFVILSDTGVMVANRDDLVESLKANGYASLAEDVQIAERCAAPNFQLVIFFSDRALAVKCTVWPMRYQGNG